MRLRFVYLTYIQPGFSSKTAIIMDKTIVPLINI